MLEGAAIGCYQVWQAVNLEERKMATNMALVRPVLVPCHDCFVNFEEDAPC